MMLSTELIKIHFPHVFNNEFNSRIIIGKTSQVKSYSVERYGRYEGKVSIEEKILVTKDKDNNIEVIKFWLSFPHSNFCYSVFNEWTARELRNRILHQKISNKGRGNIVNNIVNNFAK